MLLMRAEQRTTIFPRCSRTGRQRRSTRPCDGFPRIAAKCLDDRRQRNFARSLVRQSGAPRRHHPIARTSEGCIRLGPESCGLHNALSLSRARCSRYQLGSPEEHAGQKVATVLDFSAASDETRQIEVRHLAVPVPVGRSLKHFACRLSTR